MHQPEVSTVTKIKIDRVRQILTIQKSKNINQYLK